MTFGLQERQGPACPTARRSTLVTIPMLSWKAPQQQRGRLRLPQLLQSLLRRPRPHLSRYYSAARQCTPIHYLYVHIIEEQPTPTPSFGDIVCSVRD